MASNFVHLHLHTCYSLLDGACRPDAVVDEAIKHGMTAVAITDHGALYGLVDFYCKAVARGLKPILGCEAYIARKNRFDRPEERLAVPWHLVVLARNDQGYHNLVRLVTAAHMDGLHRVPRADKELLWRHHGGIIGLSGCSDGEIPQRLLAGDMDGAVKAAGEYSDIFGKDSFFLEVQDHGRLDDRRLVVAMIDLSRRTGLKLVASNDIHYLRREHAASHEVLRCIHGQTTMGDPRRPRLPTAEYYFKSGREMEALFKELPDAVARTAVIAAQCDVEIKMGEIHFPAFQFPVATTSREFLLNLVRQGIRDKYHLADVDHPVDSREKEIVDRFRHEFGVIEKTGFINYFLVVWDFVRYARERGIPVGLRGSGGASLVGYAIGITDIDPLKYGLVFERFLNPYRVSPPDFDIDFCQVRRGEILEYIRHRYGRERVAQIITFGTLAARAVIRDVGRVLEMPYAECEKLVKLIPEDPGIALHQALEKSPELKRQYDTDKAVRTVLDHCLVLDGLPKGTGTHAAGVVIGDKDLADIVPLSRDKDGHVITQYAMEPLAEIGLLKMDLLGLRTLTVVQETLDLLKTTRGIPLNIAAISENDPATYALFDRGDTIGVFQLESEGMRDLSKRVGIDSIADLSAMIALYRPGPMQMLDEYIGRKSGKLHVEYPHPLLEPVLKETYGVIIYQEQVLMAAHVLAGYSLGQADLLRRAMGKKDIVEMEQQRRHFVDGCRKAHGIVSTTSERIFDTLSRFAGYGFNKAHSAAYAQLSYRTAYLKANCPAEFMSALLSSEMGDAGKMGFFLTEAREMEIEILTPDINASGIRFSPENGGIRFGLNGIRNVGSAAADLIVAERDRAGRFLGLVDFCTRVDGHIVNRRVVESLVRCGCFDFTGLHRARLFRGVERAMAQGSVRQRDRRSGQKSLFDMFSDNTGDSQALPDCEPWHECELLAAEKELLGFYISGHPLAQHMFLMDRLHIAGAGKIQGMNPGDAIRTGGIVSRVERGFAQGGRQSAVMELETLDGCMDVVVPPELYATVRELVRDRAALLVEGSVSDVKSSEVQADSIHPLEDAPRLLVESVHVHIAASHLSGSRIDQVRAILRNHPGPVPLMLCVELQGGEKVYVDTDHKTWNVLPADRLVHEIERLLGEKSVYMVARPVRSR